VGWSSASRPTSGALAQRWSKALPFKSEQDTLSIRCQCYILWKCFTTITHGALQANALMDVPGLSGSCQRWMKTTGSCESPLLMTRLVGNSQCLAASFARFASRNKQTRTDTHIPETRTPLRPKDHDRTMLWDLGAWCDSASGLIWFNALKRLDVKVVSPCSDEKLCRKWYRPFWKQADARLI